MSHTCKGRRKHFQLFLVNKVVHTHDTDGYYGCHGFRSSSGSFHHTAWLNCPVRCLLFIGCLFRLFLCCWKCEFPRGSHPKGIPEVYVWSFHHGC